MSSHLLLSVIHTLALFALIIQMLDTNSEGNEGLSFWKWLIALDKT